QQSTQIDTPVHLPVGFGANYISRSPEFSLVASHAIDTKIAKALTQQSLDPFYELAEKEQNDYKYKPQNKVNMDETNQFKFRKRRKVFKRKGDIQPFHEERSDRETTTTIAMPNASSSAFLKVQVIWKGDSIPPEFDLLPNSQFRKQYSKKGWQTTDTWNEYLLLDIIPEMVEIRGDRNDLSSTERSQLTVDGFITHLSSEVLEDCIKWRIDVITLPSHSSYFTQPADRGINKQFKIGMKKVYIDANADAKTRREQLVQAILEDVQQARNIKKIKEAREATGLQLINRAITKQLPETYVEKKGNVKEQQLIE
ncbi:MAG: hypothetical protein EZS28_050852, partial [Streblomastix strix]